MIVGVVRVKIISSFGAESPATDHVSAALSVLHWLPVAQRIIIIRRNI